MTSKERVLASINHEQPDRVPIDFGGNFITGIHVSVVEQLRDHYGLEKRPVKVCEPYQMLGEVEDDLKDVMGVDVTSIFPNRTLFGFVNENWKEYRTWWGQTVLVSEHFHTKEDDTGVYVYPEGDRSAAPSAHMPTTGYFFDTIIRQEEIDEDTLKIEDNLEEFKLMTDQEAAYWEQEADRLRGCDRAVAHGREPGPPALGERALDARIHHVSGSRVCVGSSRQAARLLLRDEYHRPYCAVHWRYRDDRAG